MDAENHRIGRDIRDRLPHGTACGVAVALWPCGVRMERVRLRTARWGRRGGFVMRPKSISMNVDSGEKTWLTPPDIIERLGPFDLDPCCPANMPWRTATRMVSLPEDGLSVDWSGKRVWCNPPYGREAVPFLRKMAKNANGGGGILSYSQERTPRRGRTGFFRSPSGRCLCADGSGSSRRTALRERPLRLHPPLSRTRKRISGVCAFRGSRGLP